MDVYDWEGSPSRDFSASDSFADITTVPYLGYERIETVEVIEGSEATLYPWVYHFDGDLTDTEVEAVLERVRHKAEEETYRKQARAALTNNNNFLAITSPTNAQTLAQVKDLTRQINGIIRLVVREFSGQ